MKPALIYLSLFLCFIGSVSYSSGYISPKLEEHYKAFVTASGCKFTISSGYRTKAHNKAVKGARNSFHLSGRAYDLVPAKSCLKPRTELYRLATKHFNGVILYKRHLHVDVGDRIYHKVR